MGYEYYKSLANFFILIMIQGFMCRKNYCTCCAWSFSTMLIKDATLPFSLFSKIVICMKSCFILLMFNDTIYNFTFINLRESLMKYVSQKLSVFVSYTTFKACKSGVSSVWLSKSVSSSFPYGGCHLGKTASHWSINTLKTALGAPTDMGTRKPEMEVFVIVCRAL